MKIQMYFNKNVVCTFSAENLWTCHRRHFVRTALMAKNNYTREDRTSLNQEMKYGYHYMCLSCSRIIIFSLSLDVTLLH